MLHLSIAMLQITDPRAGAAVVFRTAPPQKTDLVAQLRWQELADGSETMAMAQIHWQRTTPAAYRLVQFLILIARFVIIYL